MQYCVHGHFYQPPREDPISNYIPDEIGAEPFKNWNERILAECYAPNARAGNFSKISFNIGPTLFKWLQTADVGVYDQIISQENSNFSTYGMGNGMAQSYNHSILPLATRLDKITQVRWGIKDFEYRFGHKPGGMWLPETAVDTETLCVLSDQGLRFTILAPWQVRTDQKGSGPFLVSLPDGRNPFIVFVYDRDVSTNISFVPSSTRNGDAFLYNLSYDSDYNHDSLRLFASDGELYGHHQPFRDLFLYYILNEGAEKQNITWTWPEKWLSENEITAKAKIEEYTSWSCLHGVERWQTKCGCTPFAEWKRPMRHALDRLAEWIDSIYLEVLSDTFTDPWELRHCYIEVMNNQVGLGELVEQLAHTAVGQTKLKQIELLTKAQYERQRMYTSCGFFFDEFHRIEPQNSIAYAANAAWLTYLATGKTVEPEVLDLLRMVRSNKTGLRGDTVFSQTWLRAEAEG